MILKVKIRRFSRLYDRRGSAKSRRERKQYLLDKFGDGESCRCEYCIKVVTFETITVDRVKPGFLGGSYRRENIIPACIACNIEAGLRDAFVHGKADRGVRQRNHLRKMKRRAGVKA